MLRKGGLVLGTWVDALAWNEAIDQVVSWSTARVSRYICVCNVHSVITAARDSRFKSALMEADMTTCDGEPIAWALRKIGFPKQERIAGPDLMWRYLRRAEPLRHRIYLYGSTEATLERLRDLLAHEFPGITLAGMHSPSFRGCSREEDEAEVADIKRCDVNVVFVGLGCPKQEKWMADHRGRVNALMIGVGAAFDYHAGTLSRAPVWFQQHGLEWLYRLGREPRRLFRRYVVTNSLFVVGIAKQLIENKFADHK
jgi:N-acetylglucosaminyldiphosphoundecaprenol N-acetyl-beta-D-mannosaminyltransferase